MPGFAALPLPKVFVKSRGQVQRRHRVSHLLVNAEQDAEFGLTYAHRFFQNYIEYGLQLARRTGDGPQYFQGRRLLLLRLGKLLLCLVSATLCLSKLVPQPCGRGAPLNHARSRLRSGRTKLATTRSAFRALARQGHPRSTSMDPRATDP